MTGTTILGVFAFSGLATVGVSVLAVEVQQMPDAVEKYGILGLLYVVLLAIGVFILRIGSSMVGAIEKNTVAVTNLTTEIKLLVQQHDDQADQDRRQIDANTEKVMTALRDLRDEVKGNNHGRRGKPQGGGGGGGGE